MHLLTVRIPLALAPEQYLERSVTDWIERALRLEGVLVQRTEQASLEFQSPTLGHGMLPASAGSLRAVTSGIIEVARTDRGLEVVAHAVPRTWPLVLPLLGVGLITGMLWNPDFRVLGAIGGLSLAGIAWALGYVHLHKALHRITADIQLSYQEHPTLPRPPA